MEMSSVGSTQIHGLCKSIFVTTLAISILSVCVVSQEVIIHQYNELQYCSFFNNRAPKAQPGLRNCTWFKENSCCLQQEIEATFGRVKPLKGASPACQRLYQLSHVLYMCPGPESILPEGEINCLRGLL